MLANLWLMFLAEMLANIKGLVFGEQKVDESLSNGFFRTDTFANHGEWFLANRQVCESLANGFGELTRWPIFGEWYLAN